MSSSLFRRSLKLISAVRNTRLLATRTVNDNFDPDPQFASGKTTVTFLNKEEDGVFIEAFSEHGFRLSSGVRVMGPTAFFPKSVLHWNVKDVTNINEESLSLFTILEPKLDILVLGVGDVSEMRRIPPGIHTFLLSKRINVEILPTHQALATFNFLNSERRCVAGAMIPPNFLDNLDEEDVFTSKMLQGQNPMTLGKDYDHVDGTPGELEGLMPKDTKKNFEEWTIRKRREIHQDKPHEP